METTVLLVDDHPIVRQGLHLLLDGQEDMRIVGEAGDGQTAIDLVRELQPDVVIMDITMPGLSGVDATRQILAESVLFSPGSRPIKPKLDKVANPPRRDAWFRAVKLRYKDFLEALNFRAYAR